MVITSHTHLKARLNTWGNQGSEREVALPRHIEQVAKAGGDRWPELEGEAVSPLGLWGEGSSLPHPPPTPGEKLGVRGCPRQLGFCKGRGPFPLGSSLTPDGRVRREKETMGMAALPHQKFTAQRQNLCRSLTPVSQTKLRPFNLNHPFMTHANETPVSLAGILPRAGSPQGPEAC